MKIEIVKRARTMLKVLLIGVLAAVILVALMLVDGVISSRQQYREQARAAIAASYASDQRLTGPLLVVPYRVTWQEETTDDHGGKHEQTQTKESTYIVFPKQLNVTGAMKPSTRRHGLYEVPVYEFDGTVGAHFDVPVSPIKGKVEYGVPYLAFTVKDPRGLVGTPRVSVNGAALPVVGATATVAEDDSGIQPGIDGKSNLRALLPAVAPGQLDVTMKLVLAGTEQLDLTPVADSNHFELSSPWSAPLFAGQFLPHTRDVTAQGFTAAWDISSLASSAQHQLSTNADAVDAASVSLTNEIDPYRLADRAVKYGILFVLLTFGGFFLFELIKQMRIHPVQYLLVGFCLAVFFLLLVSFSEHMSFAPGYLIASAACIGLLTYYLAFVLKSRVYGLTFGAILATLYAAIYGLLISEDNALLLGSLLLFGLIALVMVLTRKVDWYERTEESAPMGATPAYEGIRMRD